MQGVFVCVLGGGGQKGQQGCEASCRSSCSPEQHYVANTCVLLVHLPLNPWCPHCVRQPPPSPQLCLALYCS